MEGRRELGRRYLIDSLPRRKYGTPNYFRTL